MEKCCQCVLNMWEGRRYRFNPVETVRRVKLGPASVKKINYS